ncbi:Uncharacterised protein [Vibrio cholerae]|nr:Uncharacterised protein [Vibrio cholerae]CSI50461.1 Uncharacterised protein [Vibrio cholerae]
MVLVIKVGSILPPAVLVGFIISGSGVATFTTRSTVNPILVLPIVMTITRVASVAEVLSMHSKVRRHRTGRICPLKLDNPIK